MGQSREKNGVCKSVQGDLNLMAVGLGRRQQGRGREVSDSKGI